MQIQRIVRSTVFRNAATSRVLLQFLAEKTFAGEAEFLKEYTIGVEALGRGQDFDPKTETVVRVQSHRLRLRLREFYETEGAHDRILVKTLRGAYVLAFEGSAEAEAHGQAAPDPPETNHPEIVRNAADLSSAAVPDPHTEAKPFADEHLNGLTATTRGRRVFASLILAASALLAAGTAGGWVAGRHRASTPPAFTAAGLTEADQEVFSFWKSFVDTDTSPIIGYTDAVFLLDDSNDLYRYRRGAVDSRGASVDLHLAREFASNPGIVAQAGKLHYDNGYTGTGELQSASMLANLLGRMGLRPIIKSSRDLTPEDLNEHNVILLGSPFQNTAVTQVLQSGPFLYDNPDSRREQWRARIVNAHPQPGEQSSYGTERDPTTQALTRDSSLFTVIQGTSPGRLIAVLGGLDTTGTQGATEFATSAVGVKEIRRALLAQQRSDEKRMPPFQALISVDLAKGYQVLDTHLTALRMMTPASQSDSGSSQPNR